MSYSSQHKMETRNKIIESARILFNRHGFSDVTINMVMEEAGLTRGGFYNHFQSKQALYSEAVSSFLMGRGALWRSDAGVDVSKPSRDMAQQMIQSYLSIEHLEDLDGQCPMIALPSDVARSDSKVRNSYETLLVAMVGLFENSMQDEGSESREKALALAALCVGGMVLARTLPNSELSSEVRNAAHKTAQAVLN